MGMIGTFDAFTTARLGIYAAQKGLSVTGNNVSNLNTAGYTRQVIDQVSFKAGANDKYRSMMDNHIGSGALVTGISQIRDPYLDIRYRNTNSDLGYTDTLLGGLQNLKAVLDEVGKGEDKGSNEEDDGLLYAQLRGLHKALEQLSVDPNKENDNLARTSADALVDLFNNYAKALETFRVESDAAFRQDVTKVNEILTNIRNLNKSIRDAEIHGDKALEMRDERNRQIDSLSEYMHIKVEYSMEDIGGGIEVEKLTIRLANDNPDPNIHTDESMLVDGVYATQLSIPEKMPRINPDFGNAAAGEISKFLYLKADDTGTNNYEELEDADLVPNNTYNIALGKLLNSKGEEWKDASVEWEKVEGKRVLSPAVYKIPLSDGAADWTVGETIVIGADTFTIVADPTDQGDKKINVDDANDLEKFTEILAKNMTSADYDVTADGTTLIFTAKDGMEGEVGKDVTAPANPPDFEITNAENKLTKGDRVRTNKGVTIEAPDDKLRDDTLEDGTQIKEEYRLINGQWYKMTATIKHTREVSLDHNDLYGALQAMRELLTGKGEFATTGNGLIDGANSDMTLDEGAAKARGIPYYQMSLDLLARQIAKQYNSLNQGYMVNQYGNYIDANGKELTMADGSTVSKTQGLTDAQKQALANAGLDLDTWLEKAGGIKPEGSGNLFSNHNDSDDDSNITAANLAISKSWYAGDVKIVPTHTILFSEDGKPIENSTQAENINHMLSLNDQSLLYDPRDLDPNAVSSKLFVGSFNDMFSSMNTILGDDQRKLNVNLNNYSITLVDTDTQRDGVSGVDLNDETMNMMMYQKAYTAACRIMTAIDEVLERLINNTGVAGR